ncbi:translation initiation factor IF-6 [Candidatus Woesearchaeota archaeon]|nr:translation initiation factor IF-6 [Candidatus Woesearchaeota archaeon]
MHVKRIGFNSNPNIGLLGFCTDKYCLVGREVSKRHLKEIEETLKVPVHSLNIAGTSLLGVFLSGNSTCLLVPSIAFESELRILDKLKINYEVIKTNHTALGNNVLCNDKGLILSDELEQNAAKQIQKALGLKPINSKIAGLSIVGALVAHNDKGGLIHRDAEKKEIKLVEKTLGVKVEIGTLNFGSPYIRSGVIVNKNGFLVGDLTTGPEVQNADYAFGFIK